MAEPKTQKTKESVSAFIAAVDVDETVLRALIKRSWKHVENKYR